MEYIGPKPDFKNQNTQSKTASNPQSFRLSSISSTICFEAKTHGKKRNEVVSGLEAKSFPHDFPSHFLHSKSMVHSQYYHHPLVPVHHRQTSIQSRCDTRNTNLIPASFRQYHDLLPYPPPSPLGTSPTTSSSIILPSISLQFMHFIYGGGGGSVPGFQDTKRRGYC